MKKYVRYLLTGCILVIFSDQANAQLDSSSIGNKILREADAKKTLTTLELFSRLYQIALDDITADDKSIAFKSTIFGVHKIFNPDIKKSATYKSLWIERRIEPYLKFSYQDNFKTLNSSFGINFSVVNANDKTSSKLLNDNPNLMNEVTAFGKKNDIYVQKLNMILNTGTDTEKKMATDKMKELESFIRSGEPKKLSIALKADLQGLQVQGINGTESLYDAILAINKKIDEVVKKVENGWKLVLSPQLTYAYNHDKIQGYSLSANAVKGLNFFNKQSTQLKMKSAIIAGSDTIVNSVDIGKKVFRNELGINQVLFTKQLKNTDGEVEDSPAGELAISAGYDYVFRGTLADEKKGQPTLVAKAGFLIGKESWLLFPFTYNFETKKGFASISVKVNLGEAPIKK